MRALILTALTMLYTPNMRAQDAQTSWADCYNEDGLFLGEYNDRVYQAARDLAACLPRNSEFSPIMWEYYSPDRDVAIGILDRWIPNDISENKKSALIRWIYSTTYNHLRGEYFNAMNVATGGRLGSKDAAILTVEWEKMAREIHEAYNAHKDGILTSDKYAQKLEGIFKKYLNKAMPASSSGLLMSGDYWEIMDAMFLEFHYWFSIVHKL